MARQKAGEKAYRALDLLTGLYDPKLRRELSAYGLDDEEVEKGWALLKQYAQSRKAARASDDTPERVRQLDAWENRWFVVSDATLTRAFPKVRAWLFNRLRRQSGYDVVLGVDTFLARIEALEKGVPQLGQEAKQARAHLNKRGLTKAVVQEARVLCDRLREAHKLSDPVCNPEEEAAAEEALWAWYLEWSGIARSVLTDKLLLNHLGFGKVGRPKGSKKKPSPAA